MKVKISDSMAWVLEYDNLTAGMAGREMTLLFTKDWDSLTRTVVFRAGQEERDVIVTGDRKAVIVIPHEVLAQPCVTLYMGVYGTDGTGSVVRPTVFCSLGVIQNGASPSGDESVPPSPTVVEQIQSAVSNAVAVADSVRDDADSGAITPVFTVGAVTTGAAGSDAEVTQSGTSLAPVLSFVIPCGETGAKGDKGDTGDTGATGEQGETGAVGETGNGIASIVYARSESDGNVYTITMTDGTTTEFKVPKGETGADGADGQNGADGADGADGTDGADGYTPVRGTDYWTDEDRSDVVEDVVSTLPEDWTEDAEAWAVGERGGAAVASGDDTYHNNAKYYAAQAEAAANRAYKRYIAVWDKISAQMTRAGDAESITADTANFGHFGAVNSDYSNPFDTIYPWSERRLCNIDIPTYMALASGDALVDCVVAWEGDSTFDYDHQYGVWVYTPEFWGDSWDDESRRYFEVDDREVSGKHHYPAQIGGRWYGRAVVLSIDGTEKTCLIPSVGMPCKRTALSTLHTYAKNYGASLDDIWSIDASTLLYLVEYASMDTQTALGGGATAINRKSSDLIQAAATESTVVKVLASAGAGVCIPGAIMDIGTTTGGAEIGSYEILSVAADEEDVTLLDVTLDAAVTVTAAHYWSIYGLCNMADEDIGGRSGYIGTNLKCAVYYRGEEFFGNLWRYVLGAYHQAATNKLYLAGSPEEADEYDGIDAAVHKDTGVVLADTGGYIGEPGAMRAEGILAAPVCTATGGSSSAPVGDYYEVNTAVDAVMLFGGSASYQWAAGRFCSMLKHNSTRTSYDTGAYPLLMRP